MRSHPPQSRLSFEVTTVSDVYRSAHDPRAMQLFGQVLELRRDGCDFNRLPIYQSDYIAVHHLISVSVDGGPRQLAAGGSGVLLSECDAVHIGFPAVEGMREVGSEELIAVAQRMVDEHRAREAPLGYAGGYTLLRRFRRDRELLAPLLELMAAIVADGFLTHRLSRLVAFGIVGRSTRLIRRLGFSAVEGPQGAEFPSPYLPGLFASFFEMREPSPWALDCRERWAAVLAAPRPWPQRMQTFGAAASAVDEKGV